MEDMLWVWKAAAPSFFTIAPDIYVPYVSEIMEKYTRPDNPLVIPEVRKRRCNSVIRSVCLPELPCPVLRTVRD